jgi:hypothetical protein
VPSLKLAEMIQALGRLVSGINRKLDTHALISSASKHVKKNVSANVYRFSGQIRVWYAPSENGAGNRNRTYDLLITNELLYRLSYSGFRG